MEPHRISQFITPSLTFPADSLTTSDSLCAVFKLNALRRLSYALGTYELNKLHSYMAEITQIGDTQTTSYVYLSRKLNMMNDLIPELDRTRRAAWEAYRNIEDVVKKTKNTQLRGHLFNTTVLLVLTYALETWALRKQENAMSVIESTVERVMQGVSSFTQSHVIEVTGGI
ncbi:hypothetical protein RB195_022455 [Necator americanus]|uniref:Uncharacterized protein n=1 Tax=Necator americanus TaxID=51031 RepID=A0ABR1EFD0_NECAM